MIAIDTDVLAVYHIFHNDPRYEATKNLFTKLNEQPKAVTIFNILELCGILATANRLKDSKSLFDRYLEAEDSIVLFPPLTGESAKDFWAALVSECFSRIQRGIRLGDAVILWTLEANQGIDSFITWNTKHFKEKTPIKILTPAEFV